MTFKSDYGMSMIRQGYKPGLLLAWYDLEAFNIDTVEPGKYCTTLELENGHARGQMCCMSTDVDRERLMELLKTTDPGIAGDIATKLNNGETRIDLEKGIRFTLTGELGRPTRGSYETFAPIIAKKIAAPPVAPSVAPRPSHRGNP